ncbi:hypothetical protein [Streptomyces sp. NPDC050856]|uniref:hypothetical protein n=1 Tax=Streptomyces sp. NPDC050856 TaxID=3154939 RepID=UPI0033FAD9CC
MSWHGGEEYRTRGQWDDGSGPWRAEHVSTDGRRMGVLNDQPNAEVVRSAVANMVTAVRIISGDRPVHYIADAGNRLGDELRLDVPTADEQGRIREESQEDVMRRLTGVTKDVRRLRTGDEAGRRSRSSRSTQCSPMAASASLNSPTSDRHVREATRHRAVGHCPCVQDPQEVVIQEDCTLQLPVSLLAQAGLNLGEKVMAVSTEDGKVVLRRLADAVDDLLIGRPL